MTNLHEQSPSEFGREANYKIVVKGLIPDNWKDRLAGMRLVSTEQDKMNKRSVMSGKIKDQAELNGILESLYRMHFTILSVERLQEI